jgi:hypothetical protein
VTVSSCSTAGGGAQPKAEQNKAHTPAGGGRRAHQPAPHELQRCQEDVATHHDEASRTQPALHGGGCPVDISPVVEAHIHPQHDAGTHERQRKHRADDQVGGGVGGLKLRPTPAGSQSVRHGDPVAAPQQHRSVAGPRQAAAHLPEGLENIDKSQRNR